MIDCWGSFFFFFYDAFVTSDVLFADIVFPFAYAVDYLPKIILEFLVSYLAGALDLVHDISFASASSYRNQNNILSHSWSYSFLDEQSPFKLFAKLRWYVRVSKIPSIARAPAKWASTGRTCTHAGFNGKGKTKTSRTSVSDENTHPHRNHTVVAQTVIGDFSQKRGASRTSTRNVDDLLLFAHITLYVHCLVFSTRLRSGISLDFHFLTDA